METLFWTGIVAVPAIAVGLHWMHTSNCHSAAQDAALAQLEAAREVAAAKLSKCIDKAGQAAAVQIAAIMACMERIEQKVDQLPARSQ